MLAVMNPPIQYMPPASYPQPAVPLYPLKPHEVPTIPDGTAGYLPGTVYPPQAQAPGMYWYLSKDVVSCAIK